MALLVVTGGALLAIADVLATYIALPSIMHELELPATRIVWMMSAFFVPFGAMHLLAARLGDALGHRQLFVSGTGLFALAALSNAAADDAAVLVMGRALQGIGAGLWSGVATRMLAELFPGGRERARSLAFYAVAGAVGASPLLLLDAALVYGLGWRAAFVAMALCGLAAAAAGRQLLDPDEIDVEAAMKLDWTGPGLLLVGLLSLVHALVEGATQGWSSTRAGSFLPAAVALGIAMVWRRNGDTASARDARMEGDALRMIAVLAIAALGWAALLCMGALHLSVAPGQGALTIGLPLLTAVSTRTIVAAKLAQRLLDILGPRLATSLGLVALAAGLLLLSLVPATGAAVLALFALAGLGMGLTVSVLEASISANAGEWERNQRLATANGAQHMVAAVGLAALVSTGITWGGGIAAAPTPFVVVGALLLATGVLSAFFVRPLGQASVPAELDPGDRLVPPEPVDLRGAVDAGLVAVGLGATNMMAMLWTIAMGRRAVGIELRGSPTPASMHWNLREDLWHHLVEIDRLMLERYGEDRIPRQGDGKPFILSKCFFNPCPSSTADARADEVITGFIPGSHIAGLVQSVELIDDRWVDGEPVRSIETFGPLPRPEHPDPMRIGRSVAEMLGERSAFMVGAQDVLVMLRRYLTEMERMDLEAGVEPRCRVFAYHRVLESSDGFGDEPDGRKRIRIEAIRELDDKLGYRRIRVPGTDVIDLGVPELFVVSEGLDSADAARLGFRQEPVTIDRQDGRGTVIAQSDYLVGLMTMYVGSQCRKRITSEFDREGNEYWARQVAIGHEEDGEIGWVIAEVPDFRTFDPVAAKLVPPGTDPSSPEYFAGYDLLVRDYFLEQAAIITEIPRQEIWRISIARQPTLVRIVVKMGVDAKLAANGVVAGDSFGSADFLTSGSVNTAMIGHASRILRYWQARENGVAHESAIRSLADAIKQDTHEYIQHSLPEFEQPARPTAIDGLLEMSREFRGSAISNNYRDDWSRVQVFVGRLYTHNMPALNPTHPARRPQDGEGPGAMGGPANGPQAIDVEQRYGRFGHRRTKREQNQRSAAS